MTTPFAVEADAHSAAYSRTVFGFWVYLMTDCLLFGTLFAAYIVLHNNTNGGDSGRVLFNLPFVLTETLILLSSSFTCGLSMLAAYCNKKNLVLACFGVTFLLGLSFLTLELHEFARLVAEGNSWQRSAFLSSYFTLVGTHGLHISIGLLWMLVLTVQILRRGLTPSTMRRQTCFRMFWHFLDVVWIFIFTIVYLMGAV
jgi:cytochrome o ubiquinol oxidase subunit 3